MARDEANEQQAMTSERMAEIRAQYALPGQVGRRMTIFDLARIEELLADNEQLRAERAEQAEIVRAVAQFDSNRDSIGAFWLLQEQARAVLASTGDGEQTAPGEQAAQGEE